MDNCVKLIIPPAEGQPDARRLGADVPLPYPVMLCQVIQQETGIAINTGHERAEVFADPTLPKAWRHWRRGEDGRWIHGPWLWHPDEESTAEMAAP